MPVFYLLSNPEKDTASASPYIITRPLRRIQETFAIRKSCFTLPLICVVMTREYCQPNGRLIWRRPFDTVPLVRRDVDEVTG
jgi:hypothetical protein